jgi:hypothetical protein
MTVLRELSKYRLHWWECRRSDGRQWYRTRRIHIFLIDASRDVGLEVNTEKTKYMLVSYYQNADQNQDMKIGNRSFENVSQFEYLERP